MMTTQDRKTMCTKHAEAARRITGCVKNTSTSAVMCEARLRPLDLMADAASAVLWQRALRWEGTPVNKVVRGAATTGWTKRALDTARKSGLGTAASQLLGSTTKAPPWVEGIRVDPYATDTRRALPDDVRAAAAAKKLAEIPSDALVVYTDGSVAGGRGGAGVAIKVPGLDFTLTTSHGAGAVSTPMCAEGTAILKGLQEAGEVYRTAASLRGRPLYLLTDSQSMLRGLAGGPGRQREIADRRIWDAASWLRTKRSGDVHFWFVPSHCGVAGNELADGAARDGLAKQSCGVSYRSSKAAVKAWLRGATRARYGNDAPGHHSLVTNGDSLPLPPLCRRDEVQIIRLRTGQTPLMRGYLQLRGSGGSLSEYSA
eukprot:TRINITY_DN11714_c0_g1_i4.p1 TRINITY_DN11714_c0_g1~~TRINITY_DN11714_c0_g1_i4.p1  ORF type:complete len:371 (+),score=35.23 TRINITY_DN11714_c0_g1_i4:637-1749(+)